MYISQIAVFTYSTHRNFSKPAINPCTHLVSITLDLFPKPCLFDYVSFISI